MGTNSPSTEPTKPRGGICASALRTWWAANGAKVLRLAIMFMAVAAIVWLSYQFWRLVWESAPIWPSSPTGAVDLKMRHGEVHHWFAGSTCPDADVQLVYPPASYAMFWPLLGWLDVQTARWLWAATTLASLWWLIRLVIRESGAKTARERAFAALLPLSMYATGAAIGNGQLIVHLLPPLVTAGLLLHRERAGWGEDLLVGFLVVAALVKPTVSLPFCWIVLVVPGRLRPALLVLLGYIVLTVFAASFRNQELVPLLRDWPSQAMAAPSLGQTNLRGVLIVLGLENWVFPATLGVFLLLGVWTFWYRRADIWLLLAVTALVARFWTYHRWYDDLLVLLPMVALFRIARRGPSLGGADVAAGVLLAVTLLTTLAPGGLYLFPPPWKTLYVWGQVIVWLVVLAFLLDRTRHETARSAPVPDDPSLTAE